MSSIRRWLPVALMITTLGFAAGCGGDDENGAEVPPVVVDVPPELLGVWEHTHRQDGGHTRYILLSADGTTRRGVAAMIDFEYEFDGKSVRAVDKTMQKNQAFEIETSIEGDTMIQKLPGREPGTQGSELRKTRVESLPGGGILGIWEHIIAAGPSYERYAADGTMLMRIPLEGLMPSAAGTFAMDGETLVFTAENGAPERFDWKIEGDKLLLTREEGGEKEVYLRGRFGPWYFRETDPGR